VRPFKNFVLPLVTAGKQANEFGVMQVLRDQSPLLARDHLKGANVAERLGELRQFTEVLQQLMEPGSAATNADVLRHVHDSRVIVLDPRVLSYLNLPAPAEAEGMPRQLRTRKTLRN
jgi:DNA helicase-2/ATP-dependent DNA helicase PcrA